MGDESILMQRGRKHAAQRRLLGQAFTREAVDGYAPLVEAAVRSNLEGWAREGCVRGMASGKDLAFEVAARALVASGGGGGEGDDEGGDMSQETMEAFRHDFDVVVVSAPFFFFFFFLVLCFREEGRKERKGWEEKKKKDRKKSSLFSHFFFFLFFPPSKKKPLKKNRRASSLSPTTWEGSPPLAGPCRRGSGSSRGSTA